MSKKSFIESVVVKSPCSEDWNEMQGTDKIRFCSHCAKNVNNLSEMTRKQASRLVRASNGNLCIRYIQDPTTKRPMFAEQLLQITRRRPGIAAGVMSASIALSTQVYAQGDIRPRVDIGQMPVAERPVDPVQKPGSPGRISGTIMDQHGAVIQNATVSIFSVEAKTFATTTSNENGVYAFEKLDRGKYRIEVESAGFTKNVKELVLTETNEVTADISLEIGMATTVEVRGDDIVWQVTVGLMVSTTSIEYSSAVARAVAKDDVDEAKELIIRGHNVNGKESKHDSVTPLFIAVENGSVEMAQMLLNFRAKINVRDASKQTPIMRLDDDATPELVDLLMRYGAKIDLVDKEGNTALILAAGSATTEVIKALIDAGADVRAKNKEGQTALMEAAANDDLETVKLLLESGYDVNAKNKQGETAWDMTSNHEVEELLVRYGAIPTPDDDDEEPVLAPPPPIPA